jgi:3-dehydroquinate synthase
VSTFFEVETSAGGYSVDIRRGAFQKAISEYRNDLILTDERFASIFAERVNGRTIAIKAEERTKSLDSIPDIILEMRRLGANRHTSLVAIGGGVVQDVASFAASIYMRGLQWAYVPTTLLSMCDSCIGGKSAINVGPYKNIAGTFHPPQKVIIDPELISSLNNEQVVGGLVEACKICYCHGASSFEAYLDMNPSLPLSVEQAERLISLSLGAKKDFIEKDEFDRGDRLLLNFGHTFGHAIEGASKYKISHGVAVGVGVLCAIRAGCHLGRTYPHDSRVYDLARHLALLLKEVPELESALASTAVDDILDRFTADKKHGPKFFRLIVVAETGDVELIELEKRPEVIQMIRMAIEEGAGDYLKESAWLNCE